LDRYFLESVNHTTYLGKISNGPNKGKENNFEEGRISLPQFNASVLRRILAQARPHWPLMVGFLLAIALVSLLDGYFTYLSKRIIDEAHCALRSGAAVWRWPDNMPRS